jgi:hypothetical protein
VTAALSGGQDFAPDSPMQSSVLVLITRRRELGERYERLNRLWHGARTTYRRLHEAPVQNLSELRSAATRLDALSRGRAALLRELKALAD